MSETSVQVPDSAVSAPFHYPVDLVAILQVHAVRVGQGGSDCCVDLRLGAAQGDLAAFVNVGDLDFHRDAVVGSGVGIAVLVFAVRDASSVSW